MRIKLFTAALLGLMLPAFADTITVDGVKRDNVLVRESESLYYVLVPESGTVETVPKDTATVVVEQAEEAERAALRAQWEASRKARNSSVEWKPKEEQEKPRPRRNPAPGAAASGGVAVAPPPLIAAPELSPLVIEAAPEPGIVEKRVIQAPDGTKSLVLRGNQQSDPAMQTAQAQLLMEQDALEAARQAELARQEQERQEQLAYEQQLYLQQQQQGLQAQPYLGPEPWFQYYPDPYAYNVWGPWHYYDTPWVRHRIRPTRPDRPGEAPGEAPTEPAPETPPADGGAAPTP